MVEIESARWASGLTIDVSGITSLPSLFPCRIELRLTSLDKETIEDYWTRGDE
jgi:hypothetical protein